MGDLFIGMHIHPVKSPAPLAHPVSDGQKLRLSVAFRPVHPISSCRMHVWNEESAASLAIIGYRGFSRGKVLNRVHRELSPSFSCTVVSRGITQRIPPWCA